MRVRIAMQALDYFICTDRCYFKENTGFRIYVDILTWGKLSSILVTNMKVIYWSVYLSRRWGEDGVEGVDRGIVTLAFFR